MVGAARTRETGEGIIAAFRFVHAADLHLDSPLRSLALRDPDLAALIGSATRQALARIVDLCLDEQVDALLLAGDLYDGEQTSMKTARFLADQLGRLAAAGIRVFIVRGNHDAASRISRELVLPETVKVFTGRAEAVTIDRGRGARPVAVHGLSFAKPQAPDSLLPRYRAPLPDTINLGLMHTSLGGSPGHDPYAPCRLAELQAAGFDYWALGHIHQRSVAEGASVVVMAGMPQGRDVNEAGAKSVTLATIGDDGAVTVEERVTCQAQFERVTLDLSGLDDWADLAAALERGLGQARDGIAAPHLVARLRLVGTTPLAWRIRRDLDWLTEEARRRGGMVGGAWVETVETACRPPAVAGNGDETDPLCELRRLIDVEIAGSDGFAADLARLADELRGPLPPECRDLFGEDAAAARVRLAELAAEGIDEVFAHLAGDAAAGEEA